MEKVFGATERHDGLTVYESTGRAVLIYGFGEENGNGYDYRETFDHIPTPEELRTVIHDHVDALTDEKILTGYQWTVLHGDHAGQTVNVWLSTENQNNFKAKHDAALAYPEEVRFPFSYKISEDADHKAIYETFQNIGELARFYLGGLNFIDSCLGAGWVEKNTADAFIDSLNLGGV